MKFVSTGRRITLEFGVFLVLMTLVGALSFRSIDIISKTAQKVIIGNKLLTALAQREVSYYYDAKQGASLANVGDRAISIGEQAWHESDDMPATFVNQTEVRVDNPQSLFNEVRQILSENTTTEGILNDSVFRAKRNIVVAIGWMMAFGLLIALLVARKTQNVLQALSNGMDEAAGHMDATSYDAFSASHHLAEGVSEQTAALEETSSSLEEMTAMIRQSAHNTNRADQLIDETNRIVEGADESVKQLITSMVEICGASEDTQKIIKAIDDIAFQTKILALNAAIEAARAGEAGVGFAVVANEIKSLAVKTADAARQTTELIESTVSKIRSGSQLVGQTADAFSRIAGSTREVKELVAEIALASGEQAHGVDQIRKAMAEIERITHQNAANAEQSASVSRELGMQGKRMREVVGELIALASGNGQVSSKVLNTGRDALRELAVRPELEMLHEHIHKRFLNEWLVAHPEMEAVYSNREDGSFVYSNPHAGLPNARIRPWWQRAVAGEEYVSPVYISAITQKPCCTISLPLYSGSGDIIGVLGCDLRLG